MAGESRTELLGWINDLLQLNYTKVRLELLSTPSMLLLLTRTQLSPRSNNAVNSLSFSPCPHSTVDTDPPPPQLQAPVQSTVKYSIQSIKTYP